MEKLFSRKWSAKDFAKFTAPSILSVLSISMYMVVDAMFIAPYAGSLAMASVNIVMPLFSIIFGIGIMVAAGSSAIIGIELGEKKHQQAFSHFSLSLYSLAALIILVPLVFSFIGFEKISYALGASNTLLPYCVMYLQVFIFGIGAVSLQLFFEFFIRLDGKPTWALFLALAGGVTNILFDYLLIVQFDMGIRGAGIASSAGIFVAVLLGLFYFLHIAGNIKIVRPKIDFSLLLQNSVGCN